MISESKFYGGAQFITAASGGSYAVSGAARVITANVTATGATLQLPAVRDISNGYVAGGPVFYVINSGTQSVTVRDASGVTLTVAAASAAPIGFESEIMLPTVGVGPTTQVEDALIMGGGASGSEVATGQRFTYSTETTAVEPSMASARAEGAACGARQGFYVAQTRGGSNLAEKNRGGSWSALPNLSSAREDGCAEFDGASRALFFGGADGASEALDVVTDTWATISALPNTRGEPSSFPWPGLDRIIIVSGNDPARIALAYHVPTDTYETLDPYVSDPRKDHTAFPHDGRGVVAGGEGIASGTTLATVDLFDPVSRTWSVGPSLPAARTNAGSWAAGDFSGYLGGGFDSTPAAAGDVYRLRGIAGPWATVATASVNRQHVTNQCAGGIV